jgi:hypothetical protein
MDDVRFKRGMRVLEQRRFEEALTYFSDLLQVQEKILGPDAIELAPVYLEYGKALLEKSKEELEEDTPDVTLGKQEEVLISC